MAGHHERQQDNDKPQKSTKSLLPKELLQISKTTSNNPTGKWAESVNRQFPGKELQKPL